MKVDGYEIDVLIQGFPGRMVCHGGLGWSTVALIRGNGHVALVDVGSFNMRKGLIEQLARRGLNPFKRISLTYFKRICRFHGPISSPLNLSSAASAEADMQVYGGTPGTLSIRGLCPYDQGEGWLR